MRVLLVEDEPGIVHFMKKGLTAEGFAVDVANDGKEGGTLGKVNPYDIIIMDYMMPERNGIETTRYLRSRGVQTPILMLTVIDDEENIIEALNAGADDYLTKPFSFNEMLARLRALLRREKVMKSNVLSYCGIVLDSIKHTAVRDNTVLDLSRKEFTLLEYFMRNPEIVLTRANILEHVWDHAADPFTNTVDVHIRYLRQKMDEPFAKKLIHTVHGVGYKLAENWRPHRMP